MTPDPTVPACPLLLPSGSTGNPPFPTSHPVPVLASQKITERFSRNPAKPADEDVAERVFLILDERIQLRYHCREDHITASKREFLRRTEVDSKGNKIIMTADMCVSFEVGLGPRLGGRWGGGGGTGASVPSQPLGRPGVETPGSQPRKSSWPLPRSRAPIWRHFLQSSFENLSLFHQERQLGRLGLLLLDPTPQPWAEQTPDPGSNTGVAEDSTTLTRLAFLVQTLTLRHIP